MVATQFLKSYFTVSKLIYKKQKGAKTQKGFAILLLCFANFAPFAAINSYAELRLNLSFHRFLVFFLDREITTASGGFQTRSIEN